MLHIFLFSACLTAAAVLLVMAVAYLRAAPAVLALVMLAVAAFFS